MRLNDTSRTLFAALFLVAGSAGLMAQDGTRRLIGNMTTIDQPGSYALRANLYYNSSSGPAILIKSDGVSLDLNGFEIMGPGGKQGTAIMVDGAHGVSIANGTLSNNWFGVVVQNSGNVTIRNMKIRAQGLVVTALPPEVGIMIVESRGVVVEDNAIFNTGLGIFVRGGMSGGNRLSNNTVTAGTNGLLGICYNPAPNDAESPKGDIVSGNLVSGFTTGMSFKGTSAFNVIKDNVIQYGTTGIEQLSTKNTEMNNTVVMMQ